MLGSSISYPHHAEPVSSVTAELPAALVLHQSRTELRSGNIAVMATCYPAFELSPPGAQRAVQVPPKDYSRPLHVDCSVEYELPNTAKPPQGVRNEPLLMIHPCYFRKIESQRRSPFINNLPVRQPQAPAAPKRQRRPQQPQAAAPYPSHQWDQMPNLVPLAQAPHYGKPRDPLMGSACAITTYTSSSGSDSGHWTDPDRSPDRPEDKHILTGKYRQYLRAHRLHPYVTSGIPLASTFPQMQQVCYNV